MFDGNHRRLGNKLTGDAELVLGEEGDEEFARLYRFGAVKQQLETVARAGESDAGPALLLVVEEARVRSGQREQGFTEMMARSMLETCSTR